MIGLSYLLTKDVPKTRFQFLTAKNQLMKADNLTCLLFRWLLRIQSVDSFAGPWIRTKTSQTQTRNLWLHPRSSLGVQVKQVLSPNYWVLTQAVQSTQLNCHCVLRSLRQYPVSSKFRCQPDSENPCPVKFWHVFCMLCIVIFRILHPAVGGVCSVRSVHCRVGLDHASTSAARWYVRARFWLKLETAQHMSYSLNAWTNGPLKIDATMLISTGCRRYADQYRVERTATGESRVCAACSAICALGSTSILCCFLFRRHVSSFQTHFVTSSQLLFRTACSDAVTGALLAFSQN